MTTERQWILQDLARSGLTPEDITIREASHLEFSALQVAGGQEAYVITYYDINGRIQAFYRARMAAGQVRYRQPKNTSNHVYFPHNFRQLLSAQEKIPAGIALSSEGLKKSNYILLVEGEKKAARVAKAGLPVVGFGGVESWRNRRMAFPEGTELTKESGQIKAKVPAGVGDIMGDEEFSALAKGFPELIDMVVREGMHVVICYDRDDNRPDAPLNGVNPQVQRAAATLAHDLRFRGVPFAHIHQMYLPVQTILAPEDKVGVDDFIQIVGDAEFRKLVAATLASQDNTFPEHPNIREYIGRKLQKTKMGRKEAQALTMAILADLDSHGKRLRSDAEGQSYYFDKKQSKLIRVSLNLQNKGQLHETAFGQLLYTRYGLSAADQRTLTWLDAQYHGEQPISEVTPHRVIARPGKAEDIIRYQISDSEYVKITADPNNPIQVLGNGAEGYLFEADHVEAINGQELLKAFNGQKAKMDANNGILPCWWDDVLDDVRLRDKQENKTLTSMLFYISPWLYKWRGTQLPVELIIGESGSGKSSLCEHRLNVLTGRAKLRNAPTDLKDWTASISNSGGLHITDNMQLLDKSLRQRLSDEICRLVTEPDPTVEARKLYSNNELYSMPVNCVFAITAIKQPFVQADLLARAMIVELTKENAELVSKVEDGIQVTEAVVTYDAYWVQNQMERFGGRIQWLAHQMLAVHRFLHLAQTRWNRQYKATHRLINIEQSLMLMGEVFGIDMTDIPRYIRDKANVATAEADWALEGLISWARHIILNGAKDRLFTAAEIADWAMGDPSYAGCSQLTNSRVLGKYLTSGNNLVGLTAGVYESGKVNNARAYSVRVTHMNRPDADFTID